MRYRLKHQTVEAIQWTGENLADVSKFLNSTSLCCSKETITIHWRTLTIFPTWWIIRFSDDDVSAMPAQKFQQTYEEYDIPAMAFR